MSLPMSPHEKECAEAALAILLERAITRKDRDEAKDIRQMVKDIRGAPLDRA